MPERSHRFRSDQNRVLPKRHRDQGSQEDACSDADPSSIGGGMGRHRGQLEGVGHESIEPNGP